MSIRVGVIGAGRIGSIHCRTLKSMSNVQLTAVCDPAIAELPLEFRHVPLVRDEGAFFANDLDAVVIASPTHEHARHIVRALERGMHALCEKPVDLTLEAHHELAKKIDASRSKLQIGFNRRFDPDFEKIATLSSTGALGKPYMVRITSRDPGLPSREYLQGSGGMFVDMTIHDFDMASYVMQCNVTEVFAYGACLVDETLADISDIDTAVITLKFANGAFGVIDNSRQAIYGYDQRVELFGSNGSATNGHHRATSVQVSDHLGCHQQPMKHFFLERYQRSYEREMAAFISCIINDTPPSPTIHDAKKALMLALAARESLSTKRPVVVKYS